MHELSEKLFPPIHISKALLENSICGPYTATDGPVQSRKYTECPKIVDALGLMNVSTMNPLVFPRALSTVAAKNVSKLTMTNTSGVFPSQLYLCCALGEKMLVPASSLALQLFFYLGGLSLSVVLGVCG